jgi:hypothetical protein
MRNKEQAKDPSHAVGGPIAVEDRRHSTPLGELIFTALMTALNVVVDVISFFI